MLKTIITAYFNFIIQRRLFVLSALAVLVIALGSQLPQLKVDASSDSLTLEYDKDLDYFREISQHYQSGDFLVVTYKAHGQLLDETSLTHLQKLRDELAEVKGVTGVTTILDVPLLYSPPMSLTEVSRGIKTLETDKHIDYQLAQKEFLNSPIYKDTLLGTDGKTTALLVNLAVDEHYIELVRARDALRLKQDTDGLSPEETQQLQQLSTEFTAYSTQVIKRSHERVQTVRHILEDYKDNANIFLGGASMITADMVQFIQNDIVVFGSGIIFLIIAVMAFIFRRWQFVLLPLIACITSLLLVLSFLATIDWRLTVISSNFVALQLIISLTISIHLIVRYRELLTQQPDIEHSQHIRAMLLSMLKPCLYTVLTTVVAFTSLVVSGIRPVIDFGWMMTIGLFISLIIAFLVIPAGLALLPKVRTETAEVPSSIFTLHFSRFTEKRGKLIVASALLAATISAVGISRLEVENRFIDYFHSSTEIHQGMLVIDQQLGGTITLDIILSKPKRQTTKTQAINIQHSNSDSEFTLTDDPFTTNDTTINNENTFEGAEFSNGNEFTEEDPFTEPNGTTNNKTTTNSYWFTQAGMDRIEAVHDYLESLSETGKVQSLAIAYKVARDLNGKTLNDFELAIMHQALPEDIKKLLITPYLFNDQTRINVRIKETDPTLQRAKLLAEIKQHLTKELDFAPEDVSFTGLLVLYNNMLQSLYHSQIVTIGAVFFGILLMFMVLFRSLALSLIALIPNMLAALVVLGGMGIVGIPLDMMTITIAAIAVGVGVDDAIHYIYRYRKEFANDGNYIRTMHRAHGSTGRAMYYTSVTFMLGFSILCLSEFIPSIYFGLLTSIAMLAAILCSLTLLPQLILLFKPLGPEKNQQSIVN